MTDLVKKFKQELFGLCEATEDNPELCKLARSDLGSTQGAYARGRIHEAKGIRRTMAEVMAAEMRERESISSAEREIEIARRGAEAHAARLLAAQECPADLIEWGRAHGIASFAEFTWMAGFMAGLIAARLRPTDART